VPPRSGADPSLAAALRSLREERGYTQERLAHDAGITVAGYRKIERAQVNPTWTTVTRLANALGLSHAELGRAVDVRDAR
jgi:transcriptional regulator with XRE-family HTH domain